MSNNKRKRAVVLALIAFFCGATAFVSVDWKRFGGGFLAFFNPKHEPMPAYASGGTPSAGGTLGSAGDSHAGAAPLPPLVALGARRHVDSVGGRSGGHKPDENLFKYGDPAAGAIPPGSFLVAQNDTAGNGNGGAGAPAPVGGAATETAVNPSSGDSGGGVSSPAPAPGGTGGTGGSGDGGILLPTPTPSPSPAPTPSTPPVSPPPPVVLPPTSTPPAPTPTQSGTSDQNPGGGGGDLPPVSAVPEASDAAMMGLGALFLAVAATRRRKNDAA